MYKSDYFAEKRNKGDINKDKIREVIRETLHKYNTKSHDKHQQFNQPTKTNREGNKGISGNVQSRNTAHKNNTSG
jgi:hypothetical protein